MADEKYYTDLVYLNDLNNSEYLVYFEPKTDIEKIFLIPPPSSIPRITETNIQRRNDVENLLYKLYQNIIGKSKYLPSAFISRIERFEEQKTEKKLTKSAKENVKAGRASEDTAFFKKNRRQYKNKAKEENFNKKLEIVAEINRKNEIIKDKIPIYEGVASTYNKLLNPKQPELPETNPPLPPPPVVQEEAPPVVQEEEDVPQPPVIEGEEDVPQLPPLAIEGEEKEDVPAVVDEFSGLVQTNPVRGDEDVEEIVRLRLKAAEDAEKRREEENQRELQENSSRARGEQTAVFAPEEEEGEEEIFKKYGVEENMKKINKILNEEFSRDPVYNLGNIFRRIYDESIEISPYMYAFIEALYIYKSEKDENKKDQALLNANQYIDNLEDMSEESKKSLKLALTLSLTGKRGEKGERGKRGEESQEMQEVEELALVIAPEEQPQEKQKVEASATKPSSEFFDIDKELGGNTPTEVTQPIKEPEETPGMPETDLFAVRAPEEEHPVKYHKNSILFYFGSIEKPDWDLELEKNIFSSTMDKPEIIKRIDGLINKYGDQMGVFERKSESKDELNEIMQMSFCIQRMMQRGARTKSAMVPLNSLKEFQNKLLNTNKQDGEQKAETDQFYGEEGPPVDERDPGAPIVEMQQAPVNTQSQQGQSQQVQLKPSEANDKLARAKYNSKLDIHGRPLFGQIIQPIVNIPQVNKTKGVFTFKFNVADEEEE